MRSYKLIILVELFLIISCGDVLAQNILDYLILQDIGDYKFITETRDFITGQMKTVLGYTKRMASGVLVGVDHFDMDHDDITYETNYVNRDIKLSVGVQITQHAGGDSDRWLLHEVEDGYRTNDTERLGLLTKGVRLREINDNKFISLRGSSYSWVSDRIVVEISYTDLYGNKPEPLEIVQAYLQKFPSTIPAEFALDRAHDERWVKDEMERRLWLCEKWFLQLQMGKVQLDETLDSVVKSMGVFLDYRERYYGIKSKDEKIALLTSLNQRDGTSIKNRLSTYRTWWAVNKGRSISFP